MSLKRPRAQPLYQRACQPAGFHSQFSLTLFTVNVHLESPLKPDVPAANVKVSSKGKGAVSLVRRHTFRVVGNSVILECGFSTLISVEKRFE